MDVGKLGTIESIGLSKYMALTKYFYRHTGYVNKEHFTKTNYQFATKRRK